MINIVPIGLGSLFVAAPLAGAWLEPEEDGDRRKRASVTRKSSKIKYHQAPLTSKPFKYYRTHEKERPDQRFRAPSRPKPSDSFEPLADR